MRVRVRRFRDRALRALLGATELSADQVRRLRGHQVRLGTDGRVHVVLSVELDEATALAVRRFLAEVPVLGRTVWLFSAQGQKPLSARQVRRIAAGDEEGS